MCSKSLVYSLADCEEKSSVIRNFSAINEVSNFKKLSEECFCAHFCNSVAKCKGKSLDLPSSHENE